MTTQAQREEWSRELTDLFEELHGETKGAYAGYWAIPGAQKIILEADRDFGGVGRDEVDLIAEFIRAWKAPDRLREMFDGQDVAREGITNFYPKEGEALQQAVDDEVEPFSTGWFFARYGPDKGASAEVRRLNDGAVTVDLRICDLEGYDYVDTLIWMASGGSEFAQNGHTALVKIGLNPKDAERAIWKLLDDLHPLVTKEDNCIEMGERFEGRINYEGVLESLERMRGEIRDGLDDMRQKALSKVSQLIGRPHGKEWSPRLQTLWRRMQED